MKLKLLHGRKGKDDDMDKWGFNGPVLERIVYMHATYQTHFKIGFESKKAMLEAQSLTGWDEWDEDTLLMDIDGDLVRTVGSNGVPYHYFGDYSLENA
jgi:hypothetical protein